MRHFGRWPLRWAATCGAENVRLIGELDLVTCPACRHAVHQAEIFGGL